MVSRSNLLASLIIVTVVFAGVGSFLFITTQYEPPRVAVVMMEPGLGDRAFADQTYVGLELLGGDMVVSYRLYELGNDLTTNEAADAIVDIADSIGYEVICAVGKRLTDAVNIAADERPNQNFALVGGISIKDNVVGSIFTAEEAAFLAGVVAGLVSSPLNTANQENNNTGYIAIMGSRADDYTVQAMIYGFIQGVEYANTTLLAAYPKVHIINQDNPYFLGSYNDTQAAYEKALEWYMDDEVTTIFAPVRASIVGIRQAMDEANVTLNNPNLMPNNETRNPLAIGADANQDYFGNPNPDILSSGEWGSWITTSVVLRTDLAIYDAVNKTLWGEFQGGINTEYNYYNGGVNITTFEFSSTYIYGPYLVWIKNTVTSLNFGNLTVNHWVP